MAAPVVRAEDLDRATREEYGDDDALTDVEVESRLLARHLFAAPTRLAPSGARAGLALAPVRRSLEAFLRMMDGASARPPVTVGAAELATTDGHRVYLPPALPADGSPDALMGVYRLLGLVQLGLVRHGLVAPDRARLAAIHADAVLRAAYLHVGARLALRAWRETWPGLDLATPLAHPWSRRLRVGLAELDPREVHPLARVLLETPPHAHGSGPHAHGSAPHARVAGALATVDALPVVGSLAGPVLEAAREVREAFREARAGIPPLPYAYGILRPEWILADLARDVAAEEAWRAGPAPLRGLLARGGPAPPPDDARPEPRGLRARLFARLQGPSMAAAPAYGPARDTPPAAPAKETPVPVSNDDAPAYDEFDVTSGTWRTEAVRVVETDAPLGGPEMWERITHARAGEIKRVRARFAELRNESRWRHAQLDGNELDMGAVIAAVADRAAGMTPDPRVHARWERARDPLAVLVLADLSGSMAGDPLALQNEALVLVAEGLCALGAPHAVYGFGNTDPSRCALQRVKGFDAPWDLTARKRLGGLRAAGASRLGAYVRHAAATLARRPEPRKLLLLLSDGHPEDRDGYRGVRGERDTALAVGEARRRGVQVHCTSLDPRAEADRYLTAIFGRGHFVRVSRLERLPERLTDAILARVPRH